jgi:phospholipid-binding lipoprotein MlaA
MVQPQKFFCLDFSRIAKPANGAYALAPKQTFCGSIILSGHGSNKRAGLRNSHMKTVSVSEQSLRRNVSALPALLCVIALVSGCSALPEDQKTAATDPYENANRKVFAFNMAVDDYALEPAAKAYRQAAPEAVQQGIKNYVSWTGMPSTAVNSGLQGKFENAALAGLTFFVNGLTFGFVDLMEGEDRPEPEDFGQTLASAGMGEGPYLMVPFLGSHTARSLSGRAVDMIINPLGTFDAEAVETAQMATPVISAVSFRAAFFDTINDVKYNSLDPYARTRSAYYQQRADLLRDNLPEQGDDLDEFETFFSE